MTPPHAPVQAASRNILSDENARLQGYSLVLARITWFAIVVPTFVLLLVNIPAYYASLHILHSFHPHVITAQLTPGDAQLLQTWGISLDFYAASMVGLNLILYLSYAIFGILLFCKKARNRVALLASFAFMIFPFAFASITLPALPLEWSWLYAALPALGNSSIMLCAYLFPDGKFVLGWTRWFALIMIAYWTTIALPFSFYMSFLLDLGILALLAAVAAFAQVYRYRYVSTPQQRQQTRLVVFGTVIAAGWNISARLLYYYVFIPHFQGSSLPGVLLIILISCSILVIPPSLGMAILRFHLWDIDMIINRTLVYSSLTFTLAALYAGLIFTLQLFLRELTGQNDEVAIVISTLVIAALFHPLRQRIQLTIARRFYRSRYDAARTLETFGASLREQVDLERLEEDLVGTVEEIMQPSSISLWLRNHQSPQRRKTRILPELSDLILE